MLPLQFFSQNVHFAISLFAALVFFAMFWLYLDAWASRKEPKELLKWLGCLLLSLGFLISSTVVEGSVLSRPLLGSWSSLVTTILHVLGYASIIYGQIIDPLQEVPHTGGITLEESETPKPKSKGHSSPHHKTAPAAHHKKAHHKTHHGIGLAAFSGGFKLMVPLGALATAFLYWRRATVGLERHLKPVAIGFGLVAASGFVGLSSLARDSTSPVLHNLVASYGWLWWSERLLLIAGVVILGRWVWQYLVERIFSQVFMVFTSIVVAVFLATTLSFSFLLVRSVQNDALSSLENAASSLKYAIDGKKIETVSSAEVIAQNSAVSQAIVAKDHDALVRLAAGYLESKKLSSIIVTTSAGQVLLRAEDPTRWGESLSDDPLIQRGAHGLTTSSITGRDDILSPTLYFRSSVPVKNTNGEVVGVVVAGVIADTAFVDGIKQATGMDIAVFSGDTRSAATLFGPDGKSRLTGIKENNPAVEEQVLNKGETFKGVVSLLNQPYLAVYAPLKDFDNTVSGMLLVGRPHTYILETAGRSIQLTFLVAAALILLSVIPAYVLAKHIARQVQ